MKLTLFTCFIFAVSALRRSERAEDWKVTELGLGKLAGSSIDGAGYVCSLKTLGVSEKKSYNDCRFFYGKDLTGNVFY